MKVEQIYVEVLGYDSTSWLEFECVHSTGKFGDLNFNISGVDGRQKND